MKIRFCSQLVKYDRHLCFGLDESLPVQILSAAVILITTKVFPCKSLEFACKAQFPAKGLFFFFPFFSFNCSPNFTVDTSVHEHNGNVTVKFGVLSTDI